MANQYLISVFSLLFVVIILTSEVAAKTFEFLNYTPPDDWTNQVLPDKTIYQRKNGVGMIAFYASYTTNRTASDEFTETWRVRLAPTLPGAAPQPQIQREGNYAVAVGARQFNAKEGMTTVSLLAFVGQGRAICVLTMATGDDVLREITSFLNTINIKEGSPAVTAPNSGTSGGIAFDYQIPPGYTTNNEGQLIRLNPPKLNADLPCTYWISPPRPSQGSLEADARKAFLELAVQGKIYEEWIKAARGVTPDGWKYFIFGTDIRNSNGTSMGNVMAMAFPAGTGQVNIIVGAGDPSMNCLTNDANFVRLFHSLNPHGWTSDGGQTFSQQLKGLWRYSAGGPFVNNSNLFMSQYKFGGNGRYDSGKGNTATNGNLETTTSIASEGSYKLNGSSLTITPDAGSYVSKFRVRLYEFYAGGVWRRKMSLFNEKVELEYSLIEN